MRLVCDPRACANRASSLSNGPTPATIPSPAAARRRCPTSPAKTTTRPASEPRRGRQPRRCSPGSPRAEGSSDRPAARLHRRGRAHPLLSREEEHALAVRYRETGDLGAARRLVTVEPAPGREDRPRVPAPASRPPRPRAGGEPRPHAGGEEVRPVPRREALVVRGVVDPRVHHPVHHGQLADGEARDHPGAAEAVLQSLKERRSSSPRASTPPRLLAKNLDVEEQEVEEMVGAHGGDDVSLDAPLSAGDDEARQPRSTASPPRTRARPTTRWPTSSSAGSSARSSTPSPRPSPTRRALHLREAAPPPDGRPR